MQPWIIKKHRVELVHGPKAAKPAPAAVRPQQPKKIAVLEDGGVVRAIELTCSCGEVSVVELGYDEAPRAEKKP